MRTYQRLAALALAALTLTASPVRAQQRRYLIEVGGAGAYMTFDQATNLQSAFGGAGRLGIWLPLRLSVEGEAVFTSPRTTSGGLSWTARTISGSLLANLAIGNTSSAFLRAGYGSTMYKTCTSVSVPGSGPCGRSGVIIGGAGFRLGVTPTVMLRLDGITSLTKVTSPVTGLSENITNYGGSFGLSFMLGSKSQRDSDKDGVYDRDDKCPSTPRGVLVDRRGCPSDTDHDGVPDGVDRCPATAPGAKVDATGCPLDSDRDGVPDGMDRCPNTPIGATVDAGGCPVDSDKDGVADGLDRCPDTPAGATVDQLGCPGDEDGDGVLDGLDRCPDTPSGATVNAYGCPPSAALPERAPAAGPAGPPTVLRGVTFRSASARLLPPSFPVLDSLARDLLNHPDVAIEIGGHTDDVGNADANVHLSRLRAEAVRNYLINRKVPFTRLVAKGYGSTMPLVHDTTDAARAANRRVEIRTLPGPQQR